MNRYYFTFGSDKNLPYQNGYVIVLADTVLDAIAKFRMKFPDKYRGNINCSFFYTSEQWKRVVLEPLKRTGKKDRYKLCDTIE